MEQKIDKKIYIIDGPNLNMLSYRDTNIYGGIDFKIYFYSELMDPESSRNFEYFQSNHEGSIIDKIQEIILNKEQYLGIIINAGGYSHTSISIRDALEICDLPKIEVHLSDIYNREDFRKKSMISEVVDEVIIGKGLLGYKIAIEKILNMSQNEKV